MLIINEHLPPARAELLNRYLACFTFSRICERSFKFSTGLKEFMKSEPTKKVAIFPFGKRKVELISPRALKHVESLTKLVEDHTCVLLFIIQRTDVESFTITKMDPVYKTAVFAAKEAGVLIRAVCVRWENQRVYFDKEVPVVY